MADISTLPACEMNYLARWVARATEKYFEDPEVQKRFEKWQREKRENEQRRDEK